MEAGTLFLMLSLGFFDLGLENTLIGLSQLSGIAAIFVAGIAMFAGPILVVFLRLGAFDGEDGC